MKCLVAFLSLALAGLVATPAQTKGKRTFKDPRSVSGTTRVERELIKAENDEVEAVSRRDGDTLRRVLADEFTFVGSRPTGERTHKDRYIENVLRYTWSSYSFNDFFIRVYDRTAVVNCRMTRQAALQSRDVSGEYVFTDVWVKRAARWQLVARHSTQIR